MVSQHQMVTISNETILISSLLESPTYSVKLKKLFWSVSWNRHLIKMLVARSYFPDFFRLLISNCLNWKIYCDDHSSLHIQPQYKYELFHIYFTLFPSESQGKFQNYLRQKTYFLTQNVQSLFSLKFKNDLWLKWLKTTSFELPELQSSLTSKKNSGGAKIHQAT